MLIIIIILLISLIYLYLKKNNEVLKKQEQLKRMEDYRNFFKKAFPDIDDKFSNLLETIGKEERMNSYRKSTSKVFNDLLRTFGKLLDAKKSIEKLGKLREKLLKNYNNASKSDRIKEVTEKSKQLVERIDRESEELKDFVSKAIEGIKAAGLDFVNVETEIELAKISGKIDETVLIKLDSRSKTLSEIVSKFPVTSEEIN